GCNGPSARGLLRARRRALPPTAERPAVRHQARARRGVGWPSRQLTTPPLPSRSPPVPATVRASAGGAPAARSRRPDVRAQPRPRGAACPDQAMHRFADSHLRAASLLAAALLASPGAAQQFLELGKQHWPTGDEPASRVVAGDLDGDGDLDIVTGSEPVRVFHNLGSGCFAQGPALTSVRDGSMVLFDADGDGDLDLLVVSDRIDPQLWRNDGA